MTRLRGWRQGRAPRRQGPAGQVEDRDCLAALRNDRIDAPCLFDGPIDGNTPRLCRTVPRADAEARRRRDPRQSRLPQGKGRATNDPQCRGSPRLFAEILTHLNPIGSLRQVQNSAAKGGSANLRRSPTPAAKSSPSTRPPNALALECRLSSKLRSFVNAGARLHRFPEQRCINDADEKALEHGLLSWASSWGQIVFGRVGGVAA